MKIVFATSNKNKAAEIAKLLPEHFSILTLADINQTEEIPETSPTIEGNAIQKADYITSHYQLNCFADDTGLEVKCLNGAPGVKSARYAGEQRNDNDNIDMVLKNMENKQDRSARFKTIIALNIDGNQHIFEGIIEGSIRRERTGENGFGYDSIFEPENCGRTFAEMTMEEKNAHSHRARAFHKMSTFLNSLKSK
ncbi:MAG: non-canonical purine NTP diphosphatase [Crocinitomicaceae bacterium]|nr:non-canonical purine NTP diphosphatase [Crocinitomicaceae bacterium]